MKGRLTTKQGAKRLSFSENLRRNWQIYALVLPAVLYFLIFHYMPLYGIQIAFKDYKAVDGIWGSEWVGFKHFLTFFDSYYFKRLLSNTLLLNLYWLVIYVPIPVFLAIMLNKIRSARLKRFVQTTIYVPHFISTIVLVGMLFIFTSPSGGILNTVREFLGMPAKDFMSDANSFRSIYIISGIWQSAGFGTILYVASLSSVDLALYDAAKIDGANIWQEIRYIELPALIPTVVMVFILDCGKMLASNTDKVLAMQTSGNLPVSDIIGVYVYNVGVNGGKFSYTAAIGLFVNIINFILIFTANKISKKLGDTSLF